MKLSLIILAVFEFFLTCIGLLVFTFFMSYVLFGEIEYDEENESRIGVNDKSICIYKPIST